MRRQGRIEKLVRPPDLGDGLQDRELAYLAHIRHKSSLCCHAVAVLDRHLPAAGERIQRLAVPMRCRTRICASCSWIKAQRATHRMEGPWTQLVTLTIRRTGISEAHAWRWISSWVSKLMARLYDKWRRPRLYCECSRSPKRTPHCEMETHGDLFQYAWVIEPHAQGWPHVHIAWNLTYGCFDLVRDLWEEITGQERPQTNVRTDVTPERIPYYLAKYLTKGGMSEWQLALIAGRRVWASTVPQKPGEETSYQLVDILTGDSAQRALYGEEARLPSSASLAGVMSSYLEPAESVRGKYTTWYLPEWASDAELIKTWETESLRSETGMGELQVRTSFLTRLKRHSIVWIDSPRNGTSMQAFDWAVRTGATMVGEYSERRGKKSREKPPARKKTLARWVGLC